MSKGKIYATTMVMTAVMAELIKGSNRENRHPSPVYFPEKRSLRGNKRIQN